MANSQTYVVKITQLAQRVAVTKIKAENPLDAAGKAHRMVNSDDPRLEFEITQPYPFRHESSVSVRDSNPRGPGFHIYDEVSPSERRLNPDPLTMFELLVEFHDRYNPIDGLFRPFDPVSDPDGWLNRFFKELHMTSAIMDFRDLIPMKLRMIPAHRALAVSRIAGSADRREKVLSFPVKKSAKQ